MSKDDYLILDKKIIFFTHPNIIISF